MIQKVGMEDKTKFLSLLEEFYQSSAVLHPLPKAHYERAFLEAASQSPFAAAFLLCWERETAGMALLSFTFSTEAGGLVVLVEELYVRPAFQGRGLGGEFFQYLEDTYSEAARIRLEVEPDNDRAMALYERMGFQKLGYLQMVKDRSELLTAE